ncbi:MAG: formate/nitrite transporter family protein [SAR324 cluster bacterium]|nr:formate/nitrite transporter family protein [SAR324 cluster bacterium]MCZ6646258.1 formate/nitrite transporter family protein [SAR324 cluster bacterium]MCZ6844244.1 formate/nitrite transporter family protein [SAR324 cluster bacterium]
MDPRTKQYVPPEPPEQPRGNGPDWQFSVLLPPQAARRAEEVGAGYAAMGVLTTFALAVLGGAFVGLGALFASTVGAGALEALPYGLDRLLRGLAFALGFILAVAAGAELFCGNNLIVLALAARRIPLRRLLRNWLIVFVGNLAGAAGTAVLVFITAQYAFGEGAGGLAELELAASKAELGFLRLISLGIMGNALVCLALWLAMSARSFTERALAVLFPVTAFVAAGFEHAVANMYIISVGLLIRGDAAFLEQAGKTAEEYAALSVSGFFFGNLLPVGIGNIIGGPVLVGLIYWSVHLRKK